MRSSVCTYSPASASSKLSSSSLTSSLSIGHYKPLSSSSLSNYSSGSSSSSYTPRGGYTSSRLSSYTPGSTSIAVPTSYLSSSYHHSSSQLTRPSSVSPANQHRLSAGSTGYSRYSSTGSSISSLSSLASSSNGGSLLDAHQSHTSLASSGIYSSTSNYQPYSSKRLSSSSYTPSSYYETINREELPVEVPRGLTNLGNTCYMNSALQALYSLDRFRSFILSNGQSSFSSKPLTCELAQVFSQMRNSSSSPVSPTSLKSAFGRLQGKFCGLSQQDTQEFLRYLINGVHEEFNTARRARQVRGCSSGSQEPKSSAEAWQQYTRIVDDSPLVDLLVGQLCSTIVCSVCQHQSHCWDPFWDLSLPLARGRHSCNLSDLILEFAAKETLDSDERPACEQCKRPTRSSKQISVCRWPKIMILHLKKFSNDGYKLTYPEVRIDPKLSFDNGATSYQLSACISHHGHSSASGHYTAHCSYSNRWFHFNDERVRELPKSFDSHKLNDAYVLFYTQLT